MGMNDLPNKCTKSTQTDKYIVNAMLLEVFLLN